MYLTSRPNASRSHASWPDDVALHPAVEHLVATLSALVNEVAAVGVEVAGPLSGAVNEVLVVRGLVRGAIECDGGVIVAQGGVVHGSIKAAFVQVDGRVERSAPGCRIEAANLLVVTGSGEMNIDACASSLLIAYGAGINGTMEHHDAVVGVADEDVPPLNAQAERPTH